MTGISQKRLKFLELSERAYSIKQKRGWSVRRDGSGKWLVDGAGDGDAQIESEFAAWLGEKRWRCPFKALVEADTWLTYRTLLGVLAADARSRAAKEAIQ